MKKLLAPTVLLLGLYSTTWAQDVSIDATYGTITLKSGFTPDPMRFDVVSGGTIDASTLGKGCAGFIANAPDFQFTFEAGLLELWISVISSADTTLVINDPNGNWICDDDSGGDLDPSVHFTDAPTGIFDVWIGTYDSLGTHDATLFISELGAYGN
ncbi:MAG: peptidase S1 [Proteobacteria bacterium]|nr:peptidase S1 [Pseudomonadota bacterium]MDA0929176.1 peptidase S1 [Pseudomonadota bacterium]